MIRDQNSVNVSGKIFWSKLDQKEGFSTLRLGLDVGEGTYNRIFASIYNPNEKAHQFVKSNNQVMLIGAWLDTWIKKDGTRELQLKAYDSEVQFYLPDVKIPMINEVTLYGKATEYADGQCILICTGNKNPKTGEYAKRAVPISVGDTFGDVNDKKIFLTGKIGSEKVSEGQSTMKVFVDYDKIHLM